jgi:hypothetical protein
MGMLIHPMFPRAFAGQRCESLKHEQSVNRALRKAYGIGICSLEELGSSATSSFAHLSDWAEKDRNAPLCQLNNYSPPQPKQEGAA